MSCCNSTRIVLYKLTHPHSLTFLTTTNWYNSTTVLLHVDSTVFVGITQKVKVTLTSTFYVEQQIISVSASHISIL